MARKKNPKRKQKKEVKIRVHATPAQIVFGNRDIRQQIMDFKPMAIFQARMKRADSAYEKRMKFLRKVIDEMSSDSSMSPSSSPSNSPPLYSP